LTYAVGEGNVLATEKLHRVVAWISRTGLPAVAAMLAGLIVRPPFARPLNRKQARREVAPVSTVVPVIGFQLA
jgi:hypothetical protein